MASPQRQDPKYSGSENSGPVLNAERRVEREVGTGRPFAWWWIWIPVVIALFWFVGWGWGPYGGWWWGHGPASSTQSAQATSPTAPPPGQVTSAAPTNGNTSATGGIGTAGGAAGTGTAGGANGAAAATGTGLAILDSVDKVSFIGQPFNLDNVQVLKKAGAHAFWIGTPSAAAAGNATSASSILLLLPNNPNVQVRKGNFIDVDGTVQKAPSAAQARHQWHLSSGSASRLESDKAYVQGANVVVVKP